jgi:hypothetical protein
MSKKKDLTIKERLAILEELFTNHLHHHEFYLKVCMFPILIGIVMLVGERVINYLVP